MIKLKKYKIGIIGKGFVGAAVQYGFSANVGCDADVKSYDVVASKSTHSLDEVVNQSDIIFLSVPTPSFSSGEIDLSILEACLSEINSISKPENNAIVLVRSTVVPGTTRKFQDVFKNLRLVFNPEFLTERSAKFDFINQSRIVLGGEKKHTKEVSDLYKWRFGESLPVIETDFESAELIKYVTNTFFATKVSFMNDMRLLSDKVGANWEDVIEGFVRDGRVGHSHLNVPGHDGKYGFGGSCFPKDIQALIDFSEKMNLEMSVLKGVWETNLKVRPEKDWEKLKGRAISENTTEN
jgi:UDPglucose 6-dehydrogenase